MIVTNKRRMRPARRTYSSPELVPTRQYIQHPTKNDVFYPVHRRPMRLPGVDYASAECCCFVTYNLASGSEQLTGEVGATAWSVIVEYAGVTGSSLHAACMMPDHVHLLLNPSGNGETIGQVVGELKRKQYFRVRDGHGIHLGFQKQFWDHVVGRSSDPEEEFNAIVWYIRQNPVKAGQCATSEEYPFLL